MFDLPEVCTIWNPGGNDGFGGITWDGPYVANCRIADTAQKFTTPSGEELTSTSVLYSDSVNLQKDSQVLFRVESLATTPPSESDDVRQISRIPSGTTMAKVWFS